MIRVRVVVRLTHIQLRCSANIELAIARFIFSEGEEEGHAYAKKSNRSAPDSEVQVLILAFEERHNNLEAKVSNTLEDVSYRKWLRVVVELKSHHFLSVGIDCAVCETPKETHDPSHIIEFKNNDEGNG